MTIAPEIKLPNGVIVKICVVKGEIIISSTDSLSFQRTKDEIDDCEVKLFINTEF